MLAGITTSNTQQNMYAMAASGSRRKKQTTKIAKKKLPKRRRRKQVKIKKRQRRIIKKHAKKRYRQHKHLRRRSARISPAEHKAKAWIAWHESRNRWHVSNGYCYGKYQLMPSYLHGDYSPANQSWAADHYVHNRYGTWQRAKYFWQAHHWY